MHKMDFTCGTHISEACVKAIDMANQLHDVIEFEFNGIPISVGEMETADVVEIRWIVESDKRQEAYRQSPEYKAQQEKRKSDVIYASRIVSRLVEDAEVIPIQNEWEWLEWAVNLAKFADDVVVYFHPHSLALTLQQRGWVRNAHVTDSEDVKEQMKKDKTMMAQYIMGQVVSCLANGMPPHQIVIRFVEEYKAIK